MTFVTLQLYIDDLVAVNKKGSEEPFLEFLLRGMSYPSCLTQAAML